MPKGIAVKPVDYKSGGLSNLNSSEFSSHHWYGLFSIHGQDIFLPIFLSAAAHTAVVSCFMACGKYILFSLNMFSGIVEETAVVVAVKKDKGNVDLTLECSFANELKIDQSVSHNGVCLTVVCVGDGSYTVTAMKETLDRSNLGLLQIGDKVNVERSMLMNGRLDGHIVQGHVDMTAECIDMRDADGSTYFTFKYPFNREMALRGYFTVDKGSVTVNGVSLTVCSPTDDTFTVAIIPYTFEHTNFSDIKIGSKVNIEFDILGKYMARLSHFS